MEIQLSEMICMHDGQYQIVEHQHIQIQLLQQIQIIIDGSIELTTT